MSSVMISSLDPSISALLKNTREQQEVVGPLAQYLNSIGWELDQLIFGKKEWFAPKTPSEAFKREKQRSYNGFPCDIAIFDHSSRKGDPNHLIAIVECKTFDENVGVSQLETYMSLEPHVKLGVWVNDADPSAPAVFIFRESTGNFVRRRRPLNEMARPGDKISPELKRLTFADLTPPSEQSLKKTLEELLDTIVISDSNVTRREDQLDQLCNILLLKLHSDKKAQLRPSDPPFFRPHASPTLTADAMRSEFLKFVGVYPDTFTTSQDRELRLTNQTIYDCVDRLSPYHLIDMGVSTVALGFQVLRTAALKSGEGQYFTPQPVIEAGIKLLNVDFDDLIIDPACGTGGFLVEALVSMQRKYPGAESQLSRWAQTNIHGVDKDGIAVKLTKAIMQIAGDGSAHCVRGDAVRTYLWTSEFAHLNTPTFADGRFSVVVTNPPFGTNLKVSANDSRLSGLDIAKQSGSYSDLEIGLLYLQRSHQLLRPGGKLGIILPETYFFSPKYSWIFDWMKPRFRPLTVANIPMEAFQGFCRAKTNFYIFEKIEDND